MLKIFVFAVFLFTSMLLVAQEVKVPAESKQFIPAGFEPLDYVTGDLNTDKRPDAVLVLKQAGEDTIDTDLAPVRPLIVLIRQANGKLLQVIRNDKAILCRQCGGVFGDPYNGIIISAKGFTLSFYGGSNWRWGYDYLFAYKPLKKDWFLVKESQSSYHTANPEKISTVTIGEAELGAIPIGQFAGEDESPATQWKVKAAKTFFYDSPAAGSKPRKGYLLKGNTVSGIRVLTNFVLVTYIDAKENITQGYVLKKDLEML